MWRGHGGVVFDDRGHVSRDGASRFGVSEFRVVDVGADGGVTEEAVYGGVGLEDEGGEKDHHAMGGVGVDAASRLHVVSGEGVQRAGEGGNVDGVPNEDKAAIEGEHSGSSSGDGRRSIVTKHDDIIGRCAAMI